MATPRVFLDASALAKRYVPEPESDLLDRIFDRAPRNRIASIMLGAGEVSAVLVRHRNSGRISDAVHARAQDELAREVLHSADFATLPVSNDEILGALPFLSKYSINITDAVLLRVALDFHASVTAAGERLVLVASDGRLLRAADAEGLTCLNPETQSEADLDALLAAAP